MPETIRNGEFLEMRVTVESTDGIGLLVIGIDQALWEDVTVNTMIPAATEEVSEDGEFRFSFGQLDARDLVPPEGRCPGQPRHRRRQRRHDHGVRR